MATVVLVRHARSTANVSGVLTGRQKGVHLDDVGREQAERVGHRLAPLPLAALVSSPLERCRETAAAIARAQPASTRVGTDRGLVECDYGAWQGRPLKELAREKLWKAVQRHPAAVTFPEGESMAAMAARVVAAVRRHDARVEEAHGPHAVWAAVTHGDPLKAVLADALGLHLDQFQRLHVDPASVSVVRLTPEGSVPLQSNTHEGDLAWLAPKGRRRAPRTGVVGGGAGPADRAGLGGTP
jgi:probable phosphomutase (TIGR03848 family)